MVILGFASGSGRKLFYLQGQGLSGVVGPLRETHAKCVMRELLQDLAAG